MIGFKKKFFTDCRLHIAVDVYFSHMKRDA